MSSDVSDLAEPAVRHNSEPWAVVENVDGLCRLVSEADGFVGDCGLANVNHEHRLANAARAVACVNALAGVEDAAVAGRLLRGLAQLGAIVARRRRHFEAVDEHPETPRDLEDVALAAADLVLGDGWDYEPTAEDEAMLDALRGGPAEPDEVERPEAGTCAERDAETARSLAVRYFDRDAPHALVCAVEMALAAERERCAGAIEDALQAHVTQHAVEEAARGLDERDAASPARLKLRVLGAYFKGVAKGDR